MIAELHRGISRRAPLLCQAGLSQAQAPTRSFFVRLFPVFKASKRSALLVLGVVFALALTSLPLLAQEAAPDPTDLPVGTLFRWLNFVLVFGGIAYLIVKMGAPYFRTSAQAISGAIQEAAETRAAAARELAAS